MTSEGPFDGVMAFSQGSAFLLIICLMIESGHLKLNDPFKFALFVAPFRSRSSRHDLWFQDQGLKISIPSLLVIGDTDKVIEREMSDQILDLFQNPTILRHPGGHLVPTGAEAKREYLKFLEQF